MQGDCGEIELPCALRNMLLQGLPIDQRYRGVVQLRFGISHLLTGRMQHPFQIADNGVNGRIILDIEPDSPGRVEDVGACRVVDHITHARAALAPGKNTLNSRAAALVAAMSP